MDGETDDTEDFGDVPAAVPADLDLDSTVKNLTGNASSMLSRGQAAFDKQEAERPEVAGRIQQHLDESDKLLAQMQDKKFDAQKPEFKVPDFHAPDPQYDPAASFASSASVMGLLASAFTRAPLKNALNASTAVMQAGQQQDKTAYDRAFSEFQQAKDTALKHVDFEKSMYQLEQNAFQFDVNKGLSMAQAHRAAAGDEKSLFLLRNDPEKYMEMGKNYITAADNFTKSFNGLEDYNAKKQDKNIEDQAVNEAKQAAVTAGKPWTAMDEANTRDDVRDLLAKRTSRVGGGAGGTRADQMVSLANEQQAELEAAKGALTGPELDAKVLEINKNYDNKRRTLYAPKEISGAGGINKEIIAIDDATPIIEAMEALVDYNPDVVGVRGRTNRVLGAVTSQLGNKITDPEARAQAVQQLSASLVGPLSKVYSGSGQFSAAKEKLMGVLEPSRDIMTGPEQFHNSLAWLKGDLADKKARRQGTLDRQTIVSPPSAAAPIVLPEGVPAGSKKIGTSGGNDVYQDTSGKRWVVTK